MLAFAQADTPLAKQAKRSGFDDMGAALQALQRDEAQGPAALWLAEGAALWNQTPAQGKACAQCHGQAAQSMRGVALRHPAWSDATQAPITLAQRIAQCRQQHQGLPPSAPESSVALALNAWVAAASRGMPIPAPQDARLNPARAAGETWFNQRLGQLDLSCAQCHDERAGLRLGGSLIPQGHPNGYPLYRLQWQGLGSLERRLRNCLVGVRAEPWPAGAAPWVALELYLMQRAAGLLWEAPAVRP
jgi:L-cysteine S-thiosulfotransferase